MNLATFDWSIVASAVSVMGLVYGCYRNLKNDIKDQLGQFRKEIDKNFDEVSNDFDFLGEQSNNIRIDLSEFRNETHRDITDVKERISFLEAATLYTMPLEASELNPRSAAAREMWQRRKQKRLEKKS